MKLMIIAGFLGSGKTTLLLEIARGLTAASHRIAIVENEVGEIGIDGRYLRQGGLEVQELFGGCICCTLSASLILTLEKVARIFQPDSTLIEPTGIARPGDIVATVRRYVPAVKDILVLTLVDSTRYEMLLAMMTPLLTAQIQAADFVVINKIDEVEEEVLDLIAKSVGQLNAQARVVAISAEKRINLGPFLRELLWAE